MAGRELFLQGDYLPDLIICNIIVPGMDGYEVLVSLKAMENNCPVAFIYMITNIFEIQFFNSPHYPCTDGSGFHLVYV